MSCIFSSILEILDIWFLYVLQKKRAPKNDEEFPDVQAEISHMRPIQGQTLKLFITPFCGVIHTTKGLSLHLREQSGPLRFAKTLEKNYLHKDKH